jgi:4-amino-4-deoxy-L-arabinose transferase-like glycosyltransferase
MDRPKPASDDPAANPGPARKTPILAWVGLAVVLVFLLWWRGHTFGPTLRVKYGLDVWPVHASASEPMDCDEAVYVYAGRKFLRGDAMYRDLTEPKPPAGYWLFTLAALPGVDPEFVVRLIPLPFVLATAALVWWLGLRLGGPIAAFLAGTVYVLMSTDPFLFGNGSNLEHEVNAFSVAALAALVLAWNQKGRGWILASGACLGMACLFKQVAVAELPLLVVAAWLRPGTGGRTVQGRLGDVASVVLGFFVPVLMAAGWLAWQGALGASYEEVVSYGLTMARETPPEPGTPPFLVRLITGNADPSGALPPPFGRTNYLVWWGRGCWPAWLASLPALLWLIAVRADGPRRLVTAWTVLAWVQVAMPGLFWQHYYLLPVPGVAVALSVWFVDLGRIAAGGAGAGRRLVAGFLACVPAAALVMTGSIQVREYLLKDPVKLTIDDKGGAQWVGLRDLGREIARRTAGWRDPTLFLWGWQSPVFIYGNLDGVSRHFFADPLMKAFALKGHPLIGPRLARIMDDLEKRPPDFVLAGDPPFPALRDYLEAGYLRSSMFPQAPDGRGFWVAQARYAEFERARRPGPSPVPR